MAPAALKQAGAGRLRSRGVRRWGWSATGHGARAATGRRPGTGTGSRRGRQPPLASGVGQKAECRASTTVSTSGRVIR